MPVIAYITSFTSYDQPTKTFNEIVPYYGLNDGSLNNFYIDDADPSGPSGIPVWSGGVRFTQMTVVLNIGVLSPGRTVTVYVLPFDWDNPTLDYGNAIGTASTAATGTVTLTIPVVFGTEDFLGVMISFDELDYVDDIVLVSLSANVSFSGDWTSFVGTIEEII